MTGNGSRSFGYDPENRLTSAVNGGASIGLSYDPVGRLQQVTDTATTQFLWDDSTLLVEYDGSGNIARRYVPGRSVDETLVWYEGAGLASPNWIETDQQGSTIATSDSSGTASTYAYGPNGEPTSWAGTRLRYTGQAVISGAGLYYYKNRVYDPVLARFLQTDPAGYDAGMNLYAYVENDPVNRRDPSGTYSSCDFGGVVEDDDGIETAVVSGTNCQPNPTVAPAPIIPVSGPVQASLPTLSPAPLQRPSGTNNGPQNGRDPGAGACSLYVAKRDGLSLGADVAGGALLLAAPEVWGAGLAVSGVALVASGYNFRSADVGGSIAGVVNAGAGYHLSAFSAVQSFAKNARFLGLGSDFLAGYLDARTAMDDYAACRAGKAGP